MLGCQVCSAKVSQERAVREREGKLEAHLMITAAAMKCALTRGAPVAAAVSVSGTPGLVRRHQWLMWGFV